MKLFKLTIPVLLAGLILAACTPGNTLPPTGPETPAPVVEPTEAPLPLEGLEPGDILVQMDYEPTYSLIQMMYEFGRVPPFTLYGDGTLIYIDEGSSFDQQRVMQVQLTPEQAQALWTQILNLGFERLETYTDFCMRNPNGTDTCIADASYTIFRMRTPGGDLREVKIYADFANDRQAFTDIQDFLTRYANSEARPYVPAHAALFVEPFFGEAQGEVQDWPLSAEYLEPPTHRLNLQAWALEGEDLQAFLAAVPRNTGSFLFEHEGQVYSAYLAPWLPGADYTDVIEAEFSSPAP
jgi:hypothetical protein